MKRNRIPTWDRKKTRVFQIRLLAWYSRHRRRLPWRGNPTPYRVWVSEIMLQQTQVKTVLPYYERFLSRFPDVRTLASAPEEDVLAAWAGLGYYSRARSIHRAAVKIVREHNGRFPETMDDILKLPGVGRYTAGAIHSIAFNRPAPVVDGNVRRVISRLNGIKGRIPETFFWKQSSAWVPATRPSDFNQAVMELGALICTPSDPRCADCPVASLCTAMRLGIQHQIPAKLPARAAVEVALVLLVVESGESVLLSEKLPCPYIPGSWGLPARLLQKNESPEQAVHALADEMRFNGASFQKLGVVRHGITYRRIAAHVYRTPNVVGVLPAKNQRWVCRASAQRHLTSSLFRKALQL